MTDKSIEQPEIPDHDIVACIGKGAYGRVYQATNVIGGTRAVKVIHRNAFENQRPYDREFMGIVKYEPVSRGHPNLVSVLHIGRDASNSFFYYVMEIADDVVHGPKIPQNEYIPRTLQSELNQHGWLPIADCVEITTQVLDGLSCLHQQRLIHRDIKPPNIIFVNGVAKLADVGLVSRIGEANTFVGSEGYVPPEGPGRPQGDLYAVGKMVYEMATGLSSFDFPEVNDHFDSLPDVAVRRELCRIAQKACDHDPKKRYADAGAFQIDLTQALQQQAEEAPVKESEVGTGTTLDVGRVVLVGDTGSDQFSELLTALNKECRERSIEVYCDDARAVTVEWAREIEERISTADAVIAFLTDAVAQSETLAYELHLASSEAELNEGKPRIIPVVGELAEDMPTEIGRYCRARRVLKLAELVLGRDLYSQIFSNRRVRYSPAVQPSLTKLETVGGAVPLGSPFYVTRDEDRAFNEAIVARESLVLVRGARQMGKTSLLARGLQSAREASYTVVLTDYQKLNASAFESIEKFYLALATAITEQLDLDIFPDDIWDSRRSPNANMERFLRKAVFAEVKGHVVWGMDEVDRLFGCSFSGEVFGMFRSWHNNRALDPDACWGNLTVVIAYATESRLLIKDMMQSPFNVGTRLRLNDFSGDQLGQLNGLYGTVLTSEQLAALEGLVGGHPYLTRLALHAVAAEGKTIEQVIENATADNGMFIDHLRRLLLILARDDALGTAVMEILRDGQCSSSTSLHRLRAAGLLRGDDGAVLSLRCNLYTQYFQMELRF